MGVIAAPSGHKRLMRKEAQREMKFKIEEDVASTRDDSDAGIEEENEHSGAAVTEDTEQSEELDERPHRKKHRHQRHHLALELDQRPYGELHERPHHKHKHHHSETAFQHSLLENEEQAMVEEDSTEGGTDKDVSDSVVDVEQTDQN